MAEPQVEETGKVVGLCDFSLLLVVLDGFCMGEGVLG